MVKLNKIYTRTGDQGETGLGDGSRLPKHALRVAAYGDVDEANAVIGLAIVVLNNDEDQATLVDALMTVQNDLFDLGADLCMPLNDGEAPGERLRVTAQQVDSIERLIDQWNADLEPLTSFILPGGSAASAHLHHARTVVRRAERTITNLAEQETVNQDALKYVNRLSDFLFVMARLTNAQGRDDVLWRPGGDR